MTDNKTLCMDAAGEQEAVAWLVEPNALSHPKMKRQLTFDRPHERGDWTVTPLGRLAGSRAAPDIVDRCDRFTPEEIYAEGRHDQWQDDKALLKAVRTREHPPLPRLGEGRLYVMSPTYTGEVMTLDAVRTYVEADRSASTAPDVHPATAALVIRFSAALLEKLAAAEKKYGYSDGWLSPDWMDECRTKLIEHIAKGDPRDVAAYCAFLWHHGESTALAAKDDGLLQRVRPEGRSLAARAHQSRAHRSRNR